MKKSETRRETAQRQINNLVKQLQGFQTDVRGWDDISRTQYSISKWPSEMTKDHWEMMRTFFELQLGPIFRKIDSSPSKNSSRRLYMSFAIIATQYHDILKTNNQRPYKLLKDFILKSSYEFYQKMGERLLLVEQYCPVDRFDSLELTFLDRLNKEEYTSLTCSLETLPNKRKISPHIEDIPQQGKYFYIVI